MSGSATSRRAGLLAALLALLMTFLITPAHAALGAAVWVEGGTPATIQRGDSIELSWRAVDASSVEGWVHQDLQRVDVPGWTGPLAPGGPHETTVTVDLPPGLYYVVVEASDGEQRALSSIAVIVLEGEDGVDEEVGDDPVTEDEPPLTVVDESTGSRDAGSVTGAVRSASAAREARTRTAIPQRAPRAGLG